MLNTYAQELGHVSLFILKALEEIWDTVEIPEDQDQAACQEAWGTWVCQVMLSYYYEPLRS